MQNVEANLGWAFAVVGNEIGTTVYVNVHENDIIVDVDVHVLVDVDGFSYSTMNSVKLKSGRDILIVHYFCSNIPGVPDGIAIANTEWFDISSSLSEQSSEV